MDKINLFELLSYGAIGLGCILAVLAYFLLKNEQKQKDIRGQMLTAIYVFMGFSVLLVLMGFVSEYFQDSKLRAKLNETEHALVALEKENDRIKDRLSTSREVLDVLMEQKTGKVTRLSELNPSEPAYFALVREIQNDLAKIDEALEKAIKDLSLPTEEEPNTSLNVNTSLSYAAVSLSR